ncbi:MAG TPA: DUF86 domain-containing protein [Thermoanaerobaculia bacterium]|nr:DUF86 domain-containing protein [Thermoanaerobaculia bacterium]
MQPDLRDSSYLWDMLEAARQVLLFTRELSFDSYSANRMIQLAVERSIQIIGEAANRVSSDFRAAHPDIPWRQIVAQRNILVHEYADIEDRLIWDLVQDRLPELVAQLETLVPPPPPETD